MEVPTASTRNRPPKNNKVIVKSEGKTYADLQKTVKENVDIQKLGVSIKNVKKTAKGDLMLEVAGGTHKSETLENEIKGKIPGMKIDIKRNDDRLLHLNGIEADLTEGAIIKALTETSPGLKKRRSD